MLMETNFTYIEENYKRILDDVGECMAKFRKPDESVNIMAVTKTVAPEAVNFAASCGIKLIGENRVQEYLAKKDFYKPELSRHFIGHLQTNKIKYIIDDMDLIQSVDSFKLASEIDKYAQRASKVQDILIEVNIGSEISKSGVASDEVYQLLQNVSELENIRVLGLMSIPPVDADEKYFFEMQKLYIDICQKKLDNVYMNVLSMGMSSDYKTALKYGSNLIRIGTALFGARHYN